MVANNLKELRSKHPIKKKRYWVSTKGQVYRKTAAGEFKKMKPFTTKDGYIEYVLTRTNGTKQHIQAQIIILYTFKGPPVDNTKIQVNHKDGVRKHNKIANLEWVTAKDNIRHSFNTLGKKVWNSNK